MRMEELGGPDEMKNANSFETAIHILFEVECANVLELHHYTHILNQQDQNSRPAISIDQGRCPFKLCCSPETL